MLFDCKFCGKTCKNKNSLVQHEIRCKKNPNKIHFITDNLSKYNKDVKEGLIKPKNQFIKAKELGLDVPVVSDETRKKLKITSSGKRLSEETKKKISKGIRNAILKNPDSYNSCNVNGRVKRYTYKNEILNGTWEVKVAEYLDDNNIRWVRPKDGITYEYNNKEHLYFPDFYLSEYDFYIEVKGYKRDKDIYKWKALSNIIIITKNEMREISQKTYEIFCHLKK